MRIKCVFLTIEKIKNENSEYCMGLAKSFKSNVRAFKVALEKNHEEGKELYAHMLIQFSTRHEISRKQFLAF